MLNLVKVVEKDLIVEKNYRKNKEMLVLVG